MAQRYVISLFTKNISAVLSFRFVYQMNICYLTLTVYNISSSVVRVVRIWRVLNVQIAVIKR